MRPSQKVAKSFFGDPVPVRPSRAPTGFHDLGGAGVTTPASFTLRVRGILLGEVIAARARESPAVTLSDTAPWHTGDVTTNAREDPSLLPALPAAVNGCRPPAAGVLKTENAPVRQVSRRSVALAFAHPLAQGGEFGHRVELAAPGGRLSLVTYRRRQGARAIGFVAVQHAPDPMGRPPGAG